MLTLTKHEADVVVTTLAVLAVLVVLLEIWTTINMRQLEKDMEQIRKNWEAEELADKENPGNG